MSLSRRVAVILPEKKLQKIDIQRMEREFSKLKLDVFFLDWSKPIDAQKPFSIIVHKLTDIFARLKDSRDNEACEKLNRLEVFIRKNPDILVIESIVQTRKLLDRVYCYSMLRSSTLQIVNVHVRVPNFATVRRFDLEYIKNNIEKCKLTYPILVKPMCGNDHRMSAIFGEEHLVDLKEAIPCVIQSFVPHRAELYKLFVVGNDFYIVRRPSLNLKPDKNKATVRFDGCAISKPGPEGPLTTPDEEDADAVRSWREPNYIVCDAVVRKTTALFGLKLIGIDLILEKDTGKYFIVDVNVFPGYTGHSEWYRKLAEYVKISYTAPCNAY